MSWFPWFVGFRYLFSKKRQHFFSLITFISMAGVTLGVMALMVVLSVMSGFGKDLQDKILAFKSHILIEGKDFLPFEYDPRLLSQIQSTDARIVEIKPYIMMEMMVRHQATVLGILIKSIENIHSKNKKSRFPSIVLGQELSQTLGAFEGDVIEIISPLETEGPLGVIPKVRKFEVVGFLKTGVYEYDIKLAYVDLQEAQRFLEYGNKIQGIEMKVSDIYQTHSIIENLKKLSFSGAFLIRDWQMLNKNLLGALKLEKMAMFVILSFIVLVAALSIIINITRVVLEKKREISILKSMGAKKGQILMIFLIQGLCIGTSGIVLGCIAGFGICYALNHYELIHLPDIYYSTSVPVDLQFSYFIIIGGVTFLITLCSSLYPAWRASKVNPLEGIRYS